MLSASTIRPSSLMVVKAMARFRLSWNSAHTTPSTAVRPPMMASKARPRGLAWNSA